MRQGYGRAGVSKVSLRTRSLGLGGMPHAPCSVPVGEASYWGGSVMYVSQSVMYVCQRVMDVSQRLLVSASMLIWRCGEGRKASKAARWGWVLSGWRGGSAVG